MKSNQTHEGTRRYQNSTSHPEQNKPVRAPSSNKCNVQPLQTPTAHLHAPVCFLIVHLGLPIQTVLLIILPNVNPEEPVYQPAAEGKMIY
jgi:hypothetical protein